MTYTMEEIIINHNVYKNMKARFLFDCFSLRGLFINATIDDIFFVKRYIGCLFVL